jgi:hypothetical protein
VFQEALTQIVQKLEDAKKGGLLRGYGLIGGLALAAGGVTRATEDIDFAVAAGSGDMPKLASALGGQYWPGGGDDPLLGVVNASVATGASTIPVQLILLPQRWNEVLVNQVSVVPLYGCAVPVVSWQALVLLKLYAGGPQDLVDAQDLWAVRQPDAESIRDMESLADTLGVPGEFKAFIQRIAS